MSKQYSGTRDELEDGANAIEDVEPQFSDEQRERERILFGHEIEWIEGEDDRDGWLSDVKPASGSGSYFKRFGAAQTDTRCTTDTLVELANRGHIDLGDGKPSVGMKIGIASELEGWFSTVTVSYSGYMNGPGARNPCIAVDGLWVEVDGTSIPEAFTETFYELHDRYDPDEICGPYESDGSLFYGSWWD